MNDLFLIAEIKSAFGKNGFLLIDSFSDFSERFLNLNSVYLEFFGSSKKFFVENVKVIDGACAIKFKGFDTIDDVKILYGKKIFVDKENLVQLSENTYFIHDLIGSEVFKELKLLGIVKDVMMLPANDVLVIEDIDKRELLIPVIKDYIKFFDPVLKRLELVSGCDLLYNDED